MNLPTIQNAKELTALVEEIGFLPFFRCGIPGFSLQECTPASRWFVSGVEGPWEWREQLAEGGRAAYGKLFQKKAGFVSLRWYPRFANYRRDGYDFDARYEDGLASRKSKALMDLTEKFGGMLSSELKSLGGFGKGGETGFETAMTALQMQTYLAVQRFEYKRDRCGNAYGWGAGRYARPEALYGAELVRSRYGEPPAASRAAIEEQAARLWPQAGAKTIAKLIK